MAKEAAVWLILILYENSLQFLFLCDFYNIMFEKYRGALVKNLRVTSNRNMTWSGSSQMGTVWLHVRWSSANGLSLGVAGSQSLGITWISPGILFHIRLASLLDMFSTSVVEDAPLLPGSRISSRGISCCCANPHPRLGLALPRCGWQADLWLHTCGWSRAVLLPGYPGSQASP